ncbi:MAG: hypothetical protein R3C39_10315 [Dehalococcoidia bacterium]
MTEWPTTLGGRPATQMQSLPERDAAVLGRIMAAESAKMAVFYRRAMSEDDTQASDSVWAPADSTRARQILEAPPGSVDWWGLNQLAATDPPAAARAWQRLRRIARDELDSGNFAADALDVLHSPLDRARFQATREAFMEELQPQGALEEALVDTLVHAYLGQQSWMGAYHVRTQLREEEVDTRNGVARRAPRLDDAAAREEAWQFVERFNRLFLRVLRALDDHRRRSTVIVQRAGQVNVADQQLNFGAQPN